MTPSNQATSPAATLTVNWRPSSADAHPAKSASYSLWRYRTGDTDANRVDVCTGANSMTIDATQMDGVAVQGDDLQLTNLPFCNRVGETTLASGRCGAGAAVGHERSRPGLHSGGGWGMCFEGHSRYATRW